MTTPPQDQRLAAALADRYRIERELGAGGMATVYLAQDLKHDREVAIKVLHPDLAAALGGERFLAEINRGTLIAAAGVLATLALAGGWTLGRSSAGRVSGSTSNAIFDAALPDSTPLSAVATIGATGFGSAKRNLSIASDGSFFVYTAQRGDSVSLWYRSLVDASTRRITGTDGGTAARISPDGKQLVFVTGNRTLLVPIEGGEPRRLIEGDLTHLQWISNRRIVAVASDGYRVVWIDPESGVVEERALGQAARCVFGQWIETQKLLLCSFDETARSAHACDTGDPDQDTGRHTGCDGVRVGVPTDRR